MHVGKQNNKLLQYFGAKQFRDNHVIHNVVNVKTLKTIIIVNDRK